jgi:hypothetical protein
MLSIDNPKDLLPTERIGLVVFLLMRHRGKKFTTAEIARSVGISHMGAWYMLEKLSRVLPISQEIDGWCIPARN